MTATWNVASQIEFCNEKKKHSMEKWEKAKQMNLVNNNISVWTNYGSLLTTYVSFLVVGNGYGI